MSFVDKTTTLNDITLTDGSTSRVSGISTVNATPSLSLSLVLYVPTFPFNFLASLVLGLVCIIIMMQPFISQILLYYMRERSMSRSTSRYSISCCGEEH